MIETATDVVALYEELASVYDKRYSGPVEESENEWVAAIISTLTGNDPELTVLDIGCGTGLFLDLELCDPRHYFGLDPSRAMLEQFRRKHPTAHLLHTSAENLDVADLPPVDLVVGLFGSPSYVTPEILDQLARRAQRAVVWMTYRDGYLPDYHTAEPVTYAPVQQYISQLARDEWAVVSRFGNFDVTIIDRDLNRGRSNFGKLVRML